MSRSGGQKIDYSDNVSSPTLMPCLSHEENHNRSPARSIKSMNPYKNQCHIFPDIQVVNTAGASSYGSMLSTPTSATVYHSFSTAHSSPASSPGPYLEVGSGPCPRVIQTPVDNFAETLTAPTLRSPQPRESIGTGNVERQPLLCNNAIQRTSTPIIISYVQPTNDQATVAAFDENGENAVGNVGSDVNGGDAANQKTRKKIPSYTRKQWLALLAVCYVNFASNTSFSILSSFFGNEAHEHGADDTEIGLIFGSFAIINSICCPIYGYITPLFGPKPMVLFGMVLSGACSLAFSQVHRITTRTLFVAACMTCRSVQALGCASYFIGSAVIVAQECRQSLTFAMGIAEVFTGLGMIGGPLLGGWLYQQGGFQLPFVAVSVFMFIGLFVTYYGLHNDVTASTPGNFLTLIRIPNVAATSLFMVIMWAAMDFNMPTLGVHMKSLNADPVVVGSMFLIMAAVYALCAPLVGLVATTKKSERISMIIGSILTGLSFLTIGPSPIFSLIGFTKVSMTSVSLTMIILGAGLSAALVPTFSDLTNSASNGGMSDNMATAGLVGGIFNGGTFFGEFIGPTIEGVLMDVYHDYSIVSSIFAGFVFVMVFCIATFYIIEYQISSRRVRRKKSPPLLDTVQRLYDDDMGNPLLSRSMVHE